MKEQSAKHILDLSTVTWLESTHFPKRQGLVRANRSLLLFPALSELYRKYFMSIVKLNSETVPTSRKK